MSNLTDACLFEDIGGRCPNPGDRCALARGEAARNAPNMIQAFLIGSVAGKIHRLRFGGEKRLRKSWIRSHRAPIGDLAMEYDVLNHWFRFSRLDRLASAHFLHALCNHLFAGFETFRHNNA